MMSDHVLRLTSLWGKKAANGDPRWLPLVVHLSDTAEVGKILWDTWLCDGAKRNIAENCFFSGTPDDEEKLVQARALFVFLCAAHDLGKATPAFQLKSSHITWDVPDEVTTRRAAASDMDAQYQQKLSAAGFELPTSKDWAAGNVPHALASHIIAQSLGISQNIAAILGAHHGQSANQSAIDQQYYCNTFQHPCDFYTSESAKAAWCNAWHIILGNAFRACEFFQNAEDLPTPNLNAAFLLDGLLIMADWIASNEAYCPYIPFDQPAEEIVRIDSAQRAREAWDNADFPHVWQQTPSAHIFRDRFGFDAPNPIQTEIERVCRKIEAPGIIVLEAPMGIGKTEAALAAAEILAQKTGRSGVFFALPTQATSNGIFPRLKAWVSRLDENRHSIKLFHGKAEFNEDYQNLENAKFSTDSVNIGDEPEEGVYIHDWCSGRKRSILSDFVVGTIDQILLAALKQKHVMMRHLGLANKVVIIDECHAYDAYMGVYLQRVLNWLGVYKIPVIILSATLPKETRRNVILAYLNQKSQASAAATEDMHDDYGAIEKKSWAESTDYPLITYTDGKDINCSAIHLDLYKRAVNMHHVDASELFVLLEERLSDGGCAGIIVNTVARAQQIARQCAEKFGENTVLLLHAGFLMPDRSRIEHDITQLLGKPNPDRIRPQKLIVVGTQVLEQSLDIDFDIMITDWCPMDLLLQRMGRLHRHERSRPEKLNQPTCYILNGNQPEFDSGTKTIYGEYLLMRTRAFMPKNIDIPDAISKLVQCVYDKTIPMQPEPDGYQHATEEYNKRIQRKEGRANAFCLIPPETPKRKKRSKYNRPSSGQSMLGCFEKCTSDSEDGEACVRDIQQETIEVILLHIKEGMLCLYDEHNTIIPRNQTPDDCLARKMAQYTVKLPTRMCYCGKAHAVVEALEKISFSPEYKPFQKSKWLKGSLFLVMDEDNRAELLGDYLTYSPLYGLESNKKEDDDA